MWRRRESWEQTEEETEASVEEMRKEDKKEKVWFSDMNVRQR